MSANPYTSPAGSSEHTRNRTVATLAVRVTFWLGVVLGFLGAFISFVPGADAYWFAITVLLVSAGLLIPNRNYQIASLVLLSLCIWAAYRGYQRGIEYQQWLERREPMMPASQAIEQLRTS